MLINIGSHKDEIKKGVDIQRKIISGAVLVGNELFENECAKELLLSAAMFAFDEAEGESWLERVKKERDELTQKIMRLEDYLERVDYSGDGVDLMMGQLEAMTNYHFFLGERIGAADTNV